MPRSVDAIRSARRRLHIPTAPRSFSLGAQVQQYLSLTRRSFWSIVGNRYFFAIVGAGLLFLIFSANQVGKMYGTTTWPVTYEVVEVLGGTFALFVLIVITFYAGDLVWRERDAQHQPGAGRDAGAELGAVCGEVHGARADGARAAGSSSCVAGVVTQAVEGLHATSSWACTPRRSSACSSSITRCSSRS